MVEAVVLDFGHTIVDFVLNERALYATYDQVRTLLVEYVDVAVPVTAELVEGVSRRLTKRIDESYGRQELQELDIVQEFQACFAGINMQVPPELCVRVAELEHRALTAELFLSPANHQTLRDLKATGFKLGLVSNITLLGHMLRQDLDRLGLLDLFDAVILSSEVGVRKPHPRIYAAALESLAVDAAHAIFVGDRLREDIQGPHTAGMRAILTREFREDEAQAGSPIPDAVIDRLPELPDAIGRIDVARHEGERTQ